ncbi:hypothetical protein HZ994_07590 [Akkermansiaceae bacterium]|nr:hypothetical protein HZ994_07590 [Akkermansiaceae bacterium]
MSLFRPAAFAFILLATCPSVFAQSPAQEEAPGPVRYRDFGAKGDGKSDDFEALAKAHDFANSKGLPVEADKGATYYIGGADRTIIIRTNTDFGTARFIIDDTDLKNSSANVFQVRSLLNSFKPKGISSLKRNQPRIDAKLPGACILAVTNSNEKRFIRLGKNQNSGSPQTDAFLVDEKGNVDPRTPIIWDFDQVTDVLARPIDEATLFIKGGRFTTVANASEGTGYHARGISIIRSKVVIDGLEHRIEGEGDVGAPYYGFINISGCANVMVRNTVLTGHRTYSKIGSAGMRVAMGSYDITATRALNVSFVNCSQTNDIMDSKYWGIIGTNFCKNITYDGCTFSRFDAHQGVTNATIRNSTLGYMGIRLTGSGTFLVENTTVKARHFIHLREDYGSTWDGDIIIRNSRFLPPGGGIPSVIGGSNDGQHDFGYTCHMPARIAIDGLHIADPEDPKGDMGPAIFANFNPKLTDGSYSQGFPYIITREVILKDVTTASGRPLRISDNPFMFRDVKVSGL